MNIFKQLSKFSTAVIVSLFATLLIAVPQVSAIPYTGDSTPPSAVPAFNIYTGVPEEGNESDFFRGRPVTDTTSVNDVNSTCETGKKFLLRVYVHNGASQYNNDNGNGPSVAKNTKVSVNLDNAGEKSAFKPSATISSPNATPVSITDTMNLSCSDGRKVKLSYVADSAEAFSQKSNGAYKLSNNIVTPAGAPIGTLGADGNMWGCWDQRVIIRIIVEVKEVSQPKPTAVCVVDKGAFTFDNKTRKVTFGLATPAVSGGATGTGKYRINWGEQGAADSNVQKDSHTYKADGKYTITGYAEVNVPGVGTSYITSDNCKQEVIVSSDVITTVAKPTSGKLAETGAGNILGIFAATSLVGAFLHKAYMTRKIAKV